MVNALTAFSCGGMLYVGDSCSIQEWVSFYVRFLFFFFSVYQLQVILSG
jgi:hypothetical protein